MRRIILLLAVCLLLAVTTAHAGVGKGKVPSEGSQVFHFTANEDGHVQISMIYSSASADLDLVVTTRDSAGDEVIVGAALSSIQFFERVECGVEEGLTYDITVSSFTGASSFKLYVTTTSLEDLAKGPAGASTTSENIPASLKKVVDNLKKGKQSIQKN